jgi:hypothetical protein
MIFTKKNLRKNPCSIYLIAYNLANLLYIYAQLFASTLNAGYGINPKRYNLSLCRIGTYTSVLSNCLSPFYLILASIDRILITSPNALTRQKSSRRLAYICLGVGTLFWTLFHGYILIVATITTVAPNVFLCYFEHGNSLAFFSYYQTVKEVLAFSLIIFCGSWAIKNIRSTHRVAVAHERSACRTGGIAMTNNIQSNSSKDRQLIAMLLMDSSIYALFSFVFAIYLIYVQVTQNYVKSINRSLIENFVQSISLYSIAIPFCTSCYSNLIVSKTYRSELKKVISWKHIFCIQ